MRILIIQTAFLGDVILITPMLRELKRAFPQFQLDVLVRKGNESLLMNNPHIDQVLIWDKKQKYRSLFSNLKTIRKHKYDAVVCVQRYFNAGLLTAFSGARMKVGFKQNPWSGLFNRKYNHQLSGRQHETERNLALIDQWISQPKSIRPEIFPSQEDYDFVSQFQVEKYYCLAPASVWFTKQLPEHKWIELVESLPKAAKIYFLGAPNDYDLAERIIANSKGVHTMNLCGKLSLLQSAALMQKAIRNFVNDSGPQHIASAMNASTTTFFCSTIPDFGFGPLADDSQIVQISRPLSCRPCGSHGFKTCPKGHFACGNEIEVAGDF